MRGRWAIEAPVNRLKWSGAPRETRTPTPLRETDFESAASTSSATGAPYHGAIIAGGLARSI